MLGSPLALRMEVTQPWRPTIEPVREAFKRPADLSSPPVVEVLNQRTAEVLTFTTIFALMHQSRPSTPFLRPIVWQKDSGLLADRDDLRCFPLGIPPCTCIWYLHLFRDVVSSNHQSALLSI